MAGEYLMTIGLIAINRFIDASIAMVLVRILLVADNVHFAEVTASLLRLQVSRVKWQTGSPSKLSVVLVMVQQLVLFAKSLVV
jgi:hypothetical protein